jgi:transketolase
MSAKMSPQQLRKIILEQSKGANMGHIGCALSVVEIIASLYGEVLRISAPDAPDRDRFVMSKGHAALALYAALRLRGFIDEEELNSFCADGSRLGVHPDHRVLGVDFSTGSLGMGLSYGVGAALAARLQRSTRRVFVLLSDAECNEGSVWEAAMFAAHHRLANLCAIVDANGQQALGYTRDVLELEPLAAKWESFGWEVANVDGHDAAAICEALPLLSRNYQSDAPHVLVARTVFGKGVPFMEKQVRWHYLGLTDAQFAEAMTHVDSAKA